MRILCVAATKSGRVDAQRVCAALNGVDGIDAVLADQPIKSALIEGWDEADAIIFFLALGATIRLIAPLMKDKYADPPVICVNEGHQWVIPVIGGHNHTGMGGGNALAQAIAEILGATAVITTASDSVGLANLDHLTIDPDYDNRAETMRRLIDGEPLHLWVEAEYFAILLPALGTPIHVNDPRDLTLPGIAITSRTDLDFPTGITVIRPPHLVVGVGTSRNCPPEELAILVDQVLARAHRHPLSVRAIASVDAKSNEPAVLALAASMGVPLQCFPAPTLATVTVPNPSDHPMQAVGTPSVAEAATLVATKGDLLVEKTVSTPTTDGAAMATAALAADGREPIGHLFLLGMGPGNPDLVPPMTREALGQADVVIGLDQYLDRCRQWIKAGADIRPSGLGNETGRAQDAVDTAREGKVVALISGGDIGTFAMASPALEALGDADDIAVTVLPGITASLTASSILGAPLGHDHCNISLSNLMTPWEIIQRRVIAAAQGDFVICLYNPRSKGRNWQLDWVKETLLVYRPASTPVGLVTDASRPTQHVVRTTLGEFDTSLVDMLTMVIIGSSQTQWMGERMVTPRGYSDKYEHFAKFDQSAGGGDA